MNPVKKILILSANPLKTPRLRLNEEIRDIEEGLLRSKQRSQFKIQSKFAVRLRDLRRALLDHEPQIVHFIGHGEKNGLILEGERGKSAFISSKALSSLFELFSNRIECVVLRACYSASQAISISKYIKYVIGLKKEIKDKAAIEFSVGFYDALGAGRSVEEAFKFGCNAIRLVSPDLPDRLLPVLKKRSENYSDDNQERLPFVGRRDKVNECMRFLNSIEVNSSSRLLSISGNSGTGKTFFCKELLHTYLTFHPNYFCLYIDFNSDEFAGTLFFQALIYLSWNSQKFSRKDPTNIPNNLTFKKFLTGKKFKKSVIADFHSVMNKSVELLPIFSKQVKGRIPELEFGSHEVDSIPDLSFVLFKYLKSIAKRNIIILAFDNYQFISESFRLMLESRLNNLEENIFLLVINRTENDVSYINEIRCYQHFCHSLYLNPFSFDETIILMEKVFSEMPREFIEKISQDSFSKTRGNLKELEYYIIQYKKKINKKSPVFEIDTFVNTINNLPLMQKNILTIAALFPAGLKVDYVIKIIENFISKSEEISILRVIKELEILGYLIINGANGHLIRPAHEKIVTVMKSTINEEEFIELQGIIVNTFEDLISSRARLKEYVYLLHCFVGILSNAQILNKLEYVINLIDLQYRNNNYHYITSLYKNIPDIIEFVPDHIVLAFLDSFQKTSNFYLGMVALKKIESNSDDIKNKISLFYAKYLTQTYKFKEALTILEKMPESVEVIQYRVNILQHLCRDEEAISLITNISDAEEKTTAHYIILRNCAHLYSYEVALENLFESYDYFEHQEFTFGKATALNNIGVVYLWNYQLEKSETVLNEAKCLMESINSNEIFEPIWNLGVLKALQNKYKKAQELLEESKAWISKSLSLDHIIIEMNILMVNVCKIRKKSSIPEFIEDLDFLFRESKKMNDPRVHAQICFNLFALQKLQKLNKISSPDRKILEVMQTRDTTGIEVFKKIKVGKISTEILFILSPHWRY